MARRDRTEGAASSQIEDIEKRIAAGAFGYPAGKTIIVDKLTPLIPKHKTYTEVFAGSAAVFFAKEAADSSVINDFDPEVAQVYRDIQACSDKEIEQIKKLDWKGAKTTWQRVKESKPSSRITRIHKFIYLTRFSYGHMRGKSWDPNSEGVQAGSANRIEFVRGKLENTKIFDGDYEKPLLDYDDADAFHFLDPPYGGYNVGIGEKKFDEGRFREHLKKLKGKFLLTYGVKGKLDTSGFYVRRLRQPRTIRAMTGVSQDKWLIHLLVTNYELSRGAVKKVLKSLGDGAELLPVEAIVDVGTTSRSKVFLSQGATARAAKIATDRAEYQAASEGTFAIALEKDGRTTARLVGGEPWGSIDWAMAIARNGVDAGSIEKLAKNFTVHGDRRLQGLAVGTTAIEKQKAKPVEASIVTKMVIECGLQTQASREYFLSKGGVLAGILRFAKDDVGWVAKLDQAELVPDVARVGGDVPPPGLSGLPSALERVVPPEFRFWDARGPEAVTKRDALAASGFFAPGNVALVDGELQRVVRKVFLYEPPPQAKSQTNKRRVGWEISKIEERFGRVREAFTLSDVGKADKASDVLFFDACDLDATGAQEVVARALTMKSHCVLSAMDAPHVREAFAKMGRPFQFVPGGDVAPEAVYRVFVASMPHAHTDGIAWADVAKGEHERTHANRELSPEESRVEKASHAPDWATRIYKKDTEEHFTLCVVLEPETPDSQKDIYSHAEIRTAMRKYMIRHQTVGFMHKQKIDGRAFVVECYEARMDHEIDKDGNAYAVGQGPKGCEPVKKGSWLLGHCVPDHNHWDLIKNEEITGLSIGGSADRVPEKKKTKKSDGTKKTVDFQGLKVDIDRPEGFVQTMTLPDGTEKKRTYTTDYGELAGTLGGDGEGLDVFVSKTNPKSKKAFWFVQRKQDAKGGWVFDEYKIVIGEDDEAGARNVYVAHIPEKYIECIHETTIEMVKGLVGIEPTEILKRLDREWLS
jgi:site-specific DNA-adenine methylase